MAKNISSQKHHTQKKQIIDVPSGQGRPGERVGRKPVTDDYSFILLNFIQDHYFIISSKAKCLTEGAWPW